MMILSISGYTKNEKFAIAKDTCCQRRWKNCLDTDKLIIEDEALRVIIGKNIQGTVQVAEKTACQYCPVRVRKDSVRQQRPAVYREAHMLQGEILEKRR